MKSWSISEARARISEVVDAALAESRVATDLRDAYAFQSERMRRIRMDFSLDRDAAFERVQRQIPDLSQAEFEAWDKAGLIEAMEIDGRRRWFNRACIMRRW